MTSRLSHTSARRVTPSPTAHDIDGSDDAPVEESHTRIKTGQVVPRDEPSTRYASPTGKGIGNLLDSLPGTGPRTLLGALALVVGVTYWLQPETAATPVVGFEDAVIAEPKPLTPEDEAVEEKEPEDPARDGTVEDEPDPVLR